MLLGKGVEVAKAIAQHRLKQATPAALSSQRWIWWNQMNAKIAVLLQRFTNCSHVLFGLDLPEIGFVPWQSRTIERGDTGERRDDYIFLGILYQTQKDLLLSHQQNPTIS